MFDSCKLVWGNGYGWREQWRRRGHVVTVLFIMRTWSLCLDKLNFSPCTWALYKGKKTRAAKKTKTEHIWADNHIQPKTILWLLMSTANQQIKPKKLSRNRIDLLRMYKIVRKSYLDRTNKLFPCSPRLRLGLFSHSTALPPPSPSLQSPKNLFFFPVFFSFLFLSQLLSYSSHQPRLHSQPPPWRGGGAFHHASHACAVGSRPPPLKNENFTPPGWPVKRGLHLIPTKWKFRKV